MLSAREGYARRITPLLYQHSVLIFLLKFTIHHEKLAVSGSYSKDFFIRLFIVDCEPTFCSHRETSHDATRQLFLVVAVRRDIVLTIPIVVYKNPIEIRIASLVHPGKKDSQIIRQSLGYLFLFCELISARNV
jgi:hypothetical protein